MADHDPPVGPLRRLDPAEPDEILDLGRLERLDPEVEEPPGPLAPPQATPPEAAASRPRNGLALAIAIAVLLSLSSIAAIGGLVAISVQGLDPAAEPAVTAPMDIAASGPTIRVIEEDPGPGSPRQGSGAGSAAQAAAQEVEPAPAPAPPPPPPAPPAPSTDRSKKDRPADGDRTRRPYRGGGWCDASAGSTCDVVFEGPPGQVTRGATDAGDGATVDGTGFLRTDEEGEVLEDDLDDPDERSEGPSKHSGGRGKHS